MPQSSEFPKAIQTALDEGWSEVELADFFGVTPSSVRRWVEGRNLPIPMVRVVMIKRLGLDTDPEGDQDAS